MAIAHYYQKLAPWLAEPIHRSNRMYLETHLELLRPEFEDFLGLLIREHAEHPDEQQRLRSRQWLLYDARTRGGSVQAVQEAYVNVFGGLLLDVPEWLIEREQLLTTILYVGWTERMVALCKTQLREAIEQARLEGDVMPETMAELSYQLGSLYVSTTSSCSIPVLNMVNSYYEAALHIYTLSHYPLQHAKVLIALGNAALHCSTELWLENLEKALHYYKKASHIYANTTHNSLIH